MAIRALIFDLDETLLIEEASVQDALLATGKIAEARCGIDSARLAAAVRTRARELWHALPTHEECMALGISSWEGLATDFVGEGDFLQALRDLISSYRQTAWARALSDLGSDDALLATELAQKFPMVRREKHVPFPETLAVLGELQHSYVLGMITNGPSQHQREKLSTSGIDRFFTEVVVSGDIGIGKPDARIFSYALDRLGARPDEAVMIGDSLERDILGAQRAGLTSIWVNRDHAEQRQSQPVPSAEISDLRQLPFVLSERLR